MEVAAVLVPCFLFFAVLFVVIFAIQWKVFTKAGRPGWESLIPFYNMWVLVTEICKLEPMWFILSLVPFVNIIAAWIICQALAKKFGQSDAFGIGLFFLGPIFLAILAFGDARYQGGRRSLDYDDEDDYEDEPKPKKKKPRDDYDD